jgi:hypothetical protein
MGSNKGTPNTNVNGNMLIESQRILNRTWDTIEFTIVKSVWNAFRKLYFALDYYC